jgi:hypothetical protein
LALERKARVPEVQLPTASDKVEIKKQSTEEIFKERYIGERMRQKIKEYQDRKYRWYPV